MVQLADWQRIAQVSHLTCDSAYCSQHPDIDFVMTLQLRPTFSESWYRVTSLKAQAAGQRADLAAVLPRRAVVRRPRPGGQPVPPALATRRTASSGCSTARRTVAEAWDLAGGQLADDAPTQPEVIQILAQLHAANLIEADITPDAAVLLRRHKQLQKRQVAGAADERPVPAHPAVGPGPLPEDAGCRSCGWCFSKFGALLWLVVVVIARSRALAPEWDDAQEGRQPTRSTPGNWLVACGRCSSSSS